MAALTDTQVATIRDYIGVAEPPDDIELQDIYDRVHTVIAVAYAVLNKRLADFLSEAASFSIVGVYQESSQSNIDNLRQLLKHMEENFPSLLEDPTLGEGLSTVVVTRIVRAGRDR